MKKISVIILVLMMALMLGAVVVHAEPISGKVIETMNSGGYTYMHIENKGMKTWAAVPMVKGIKVGDMVKLQPGMTMQNFTSKTLKRTFETIFFSGGLAQ